MDTTTLEKYQASFQTLNPKGNGIKPGGATSSSKYRCTPTSRGSAARLQKYAAPRRGAKSFTDRSGRRTGTNLAIVDATKLVHQWPPCRQSSPAVR